MKLAKIIYRGEIFLKENQYIRFFSPLIWPESLKLKLLFVSSLVCVVFGIVVNLLVPIYSQKIVDSLSLSSSVYFNLSILLVLKVLQGVGTLSLLNIIQSLLWIKLEQYAHKHVQMNFFTHLHKMSVSWQLSQKTGDILGPLERGSAAVTSIIERVLYTILPTIANLFVAILYLSFKYNWTIGGIVCFQVVSYVWTTFKFTEWRSRFQKCLNGAEDKQRQQAMESLLNFETVKLFSNEEHETLKYSETIDNFHKQEFAVLSSLNLLQLMQLFIVNFAMLTGTFLTVSSIIEDERLGVGDYVLFSSYMAQLIGPLNYLGSHYNALRINFVNLKEMMRILQEDNDKISEQTSTTQTINVDEGEIEFKDVCFSHTPEKTLLQGFSLRIPAKKTVALVGQSGQGKSSIVRLLTRIYECESGEILIDGKNVKNMDANKLRKLIGVVPQDTLLFHDTIKNNLKYAKLDATDYEVVLAAQYAQIHDKISSLPLKYETMVGERGLKLSCGEKQRIAIARMFLKNPKIMLLDEATSSLDVKTEAEIMSAFFRLCHNRTSLLVTHRLQSLHNVDNIFVLKNGKIIESGKFSELLELKGEFHSMWKRQFCKKFG